MSKSRKLVIVGDGEFASIAHEYFTHDSAYEVAGFAVEQAFRKQEEYCGLPVVGFEEVERHFPPDRYEAYVAITYTQLNRVRARLYAAAKAKGYRAASYVSSRAFVWRNVTLGDNVFIFEGNVIQHHAAIGDDVVLWSGNHIGHRTVIEPHCYISSHVVISGYCRVGAYSFIGVNATLADRVTVGRDGFIGAGSLILKDTEPGTIYRAAPAEPAKVGSLRFMGVKDAGDAE
jgi:sugar O-acyltransferase (sialic acid O-acetyltransferase NeuD family)